MINEFVYPLRVHIEDTDFAGVVYHANYLNYFERARSEWAEELGFGLNWQSSHKIYFPIHTISIQYLKPARLGEKMEVVTHIKSLRPASILYDQYLRSADSRDKIFCKAEVKIACVNYTMRPRLLPSAQIFETIKQVLKN